MGADSGNGNVIIGSVIYVNATTGAPQATLTGNGGCNVSGTIGNSTASVFPAISNFQAFKFLTLSIASATNLRKTYVKTDGTTSSNTAAGTRVANSVVKFRFGSNGGGGGYLGSCDVAWGAIYNRVLSDAEVDTTYQFVKGYLSAKRGITV
jgi:hypothetical protein